MSEAMAASLREAVVKALNEHRPPVYGACKCGWQVPGYPYSNGSVHWRHHMADVIVAAVLWSEAPTPPQVAVGDEAMEAAGDG